MQEPLLCCHRIYVTVIPQPFSFRISVIIDKQGNMATYPADYRPIAGAQMSYTHPKFHDNSWKFAKPRVRCYTNPRVKYRQHEYIDEKCTAMREKPIVIGCDNSKCKMNCKEVSAEVQEDARMWMMLRIYGGQDYSLLCKHLTRSHIDVKGPWTIQEEYQENEM